MPRAKLADRFKGRFDALRVTKVAVQADKAVAVAQENFSMIDGALPGGLVSTLETTLIDLQDRIAALEP